MTQPLDRNYRTPAKGAIDEEAGEFWVENPYELPERRHNLSAFERNKIYINQGGKRFVDLSFESGADIDSDSRSIVVADFNRDGAPDLLIGSIGGGPLRLFLNRIPQQSHRIRLELVGTESNRSAIGTRVIARCGKQQIVRDLFASNGFKGQSPPELILGVGTAEVIDHLEIRWPTGKVQRFANVPVDCQITITEGQADFQVSGTGLRAPAEIFDPVPRSQ